MILIFIINIWVANVLLIPCIWCWWGCFGDFMMIIVSRACWLWLLLLSSSSTWYDHDHHDHSHHHYDDHNLMITDLDQCDIGLSSLHPWVEVANSPDHHFYSVLIILINTAINLINILIIRTIIFAIYRGSVFSSSKDNLCDHLDCHSNHQKIWVRSPFQTVKNVHTLKFDTITLIIASSIHHQHHTPSYIFKSSSQLFWVPAKTSFSKAQMGVKVANLFRYNKIWIRKRKSDTDTDNIDLKIPLPQ